MSENETESYRYYRKVYCDGMIFQSIIRDVLLFIVNVFLLFVMIPQASTFTFSLILSSTALISIISSFHFGVLSNGKALELLYTENDSEDDDNFYDNIVDKLSFCSLSWTGLSLIGFIIMLLF